MPQILDGHGSELATFEAIYPPSLTFTKIVAASFDDKPVKPANWNRLLQTALIAGHKRMGSFEKLKKLAAVRMIPGEKTDEGYLYFPEVDFSVQRTDANAAWRGIVFVARGLNFSVVVSFVWSNKEAAEHPGKSGTMRLYRK